MAADNRFGWTTHPETADFVGELVFSFCRSCVPASHLANRLLDETGTRLIDWIDFLTVPARGEVPARLASLGFEPDGTPVPTAWRHATGLFPAIVLEEAPPRKLALRVDTVADFVAAHGVENIQIHGAPWVPLRKAMIWSEGDAEFWIVERHGCREFETLAVSPEQTTAALSHAEAFRLRKRHFPRDEIGFAHASRLIQTAVNDLGADWACDLFLAAERQYWQSRNRAARLQKSRQDALGLGWSNHDHHTYRSSREHFATLIANLEQLDFICRERFYSGREAGWGAQVLEQPNCGAVVFADVDLTPEEVSGDFAHQALEPTRDLGTVGLWCKLHGEAFLQAGMHHLECQFDFDAAREQLLREGAPSMNPFTDFDYLKQCFTEGEIWPVDTSRVESALQDRLITPAQAEQFRRHGAIGSHLEILERDAGYKGFNQTGISEIIAQTDPRRSANRKRPE